MMEGKNKTPDYEVEKEKMGVQMDNRRAEIENMISKFTEKLSANPIKLYTQHTGSSPSESGSLDKVKNVSFDESGTGGDSSIDFGNHEYIAVNKDGLRTSTYFNSENDYYKVNNDSYHNILTMMDELIKNSGYSETEKSKMFKYVIDNFKNKILKE